MEPLPLFARFTYHTAVVLLYISPTQLTIRHAEQL